MGCCSSTLATLATTLTCFFTMAPAAAADAEASVATYVRYDSDDTTVVSPRLRLRFSPLEDTDLALTYAVDVWTGASIDIRTMATPAVTEQRDELVATVTHSASQLIVNGTYRYSTEVDYSSHAVSGGLRYAFARGASAINVGGDASTDVVGRAGDPTYTRGLQQLGAHLSLEQFVDANTLLAAGYNFALLSGFQGSPYRYVGLGGDGYGCRGALLCLPERLPHERLRHALLLQARRALSDVTSLRLDYRFYVDSWGLAGHSLEGTLAWLPDDQSQLTLRARVHGQGATSFYQSRYPVSEQTPSYYTRDRELSALNHLRGAVEYSRTFALGGDALTLSSSLAASILRYADFVGLREVVAFEATVFAGIDL